MTLADIQKSMNKATDTKQALQTVDAIQLPVGTVLQHKRSGEMLTITSSRIHYIDGLIYDAVWANGYTWLVHGYNVTELFNIINQPTEAKQ